MKCRNVKLNSKTARVLQRIEEDWRNGVGQTYATASFVRLKGYVVPDIPKEAICGRFARRTSTQDVTDKCDISAASPTELLDLSGWAPLAVVIWRYTWTSVTQHAERMKGDIRSAPHFCGWRQVISSDFAFHFEDYQFNHLRYCRPRCEPLCCSPALQHFACSNASSLCLPSQQLEVGKDQDCFP
ncbi:hypothetical protein CBM2638_U10001 [Cupriavidus taiwanensis]|nr:hypothetical protein CBM2638_U10001 [Cupriavidus taiwanensis]